MSLINCNVELKLKWTKHCVFSVLGNDNDNANSNNTIFIIKGTKLAKAVTLSAKDSLKISALLSKGFKRLVCWNEYKIKSENNNTTNEYIYSLDFLESNFVGVNRFFVLTKMIIQKGIKL